MELTETHIRYLLGMLQLSGGTGEMRLTEIANVMHVKKASVARIVDVFREKELVDQQHYGKVRLTQRGREEARRCELSVRGLAGRLERTGLPFSEQEAFEAACHLLPDLPESCQSYVRENFLFDKVIDN